MEDDQDGEQISYEVTQQRLYDMHKLVHDVCAINLLVYIFVMSSCNTYCMKYTRTVLDLKLLRVFLF